MSNRRAEGDLYLSTIVCFRSAMLQIGVSLGGQRDTVEVYVFKNPISASAHVCQAETLDLLAKFV
jgi:hypothetical protein